MAWTAPRTWVTGELVTAALMNTHVRDNLLALYNSMPAARVYHNANQNVGLGAVLYLAFDSERFDNDTIHDVVVNNSRLTATTAGKYAIFGSVHWALGAGVDSAIVIRYNGVNPLAAQGISGMSATCVDIAVATLYDMAATDYVELGATHSFAGGLNVLAQPNYSPEFSMVKVG